MQKLIYSWLTEIRSFPIIERRPRTVILCYCYSLACKDETTITGTMTASVIDLRPSPPTSLARTEMLHHQAYYQLDGCTTLSKTNEHCRSLFNLLPTSLRPRHHKKGVDAVSMTKKGGGEGAREVSYCIILPFVVTQWHFIHLSLVACRRSALAVDRRSWLFFFLVLRAIEL